MHERRWQRAGFAALGGVLLAGGVLLLAFAEQRKAGFILGGTAATAIGVLRTLAAITTPCSVKARGSLRRPPQIELDVANCNFKFANS